MEMNEETMVKNVANQTPETQGKTLKTNDNKQQIETKNKELLRRIGRYCVNLEDLENIGAKAIMDAVKDSDVVAVDELGPMELFSDKFREAVRKAVESDKLVAGVVHWKAKDKLVEEVKSREDAELFTVTSENRDKLHEVVLAKALDFLSNI
jgi:nucleoside-triphosphatase THEP1